MRIEQHPMDLYLAAMQEFASPAPQRTIEEAVDLPAVQESLSLAAAAASRRLVQHINGQTTAGMR